LNISGLTFDVSDTLSAISAFGTLVLAFFTFLVYRRQAEIMATQTELSKRQQQFTEESDFPMPMVEITLIPKDSREYHYLKVHVFNNSHYFLKLHSVKIELLAESKLPPNIISSPPSPLTLLNIVVPPKKKWESSHNTTYWECSASVFCDLAMSTPYSLKIYFYHPLTNKLTSKTSQTAMTSDETCTLINREQWGLTQ
jgi:hypothetical protein